MPLEVPENPLFRTTLTEALCPLPRKLEVHKVVEIASSEISIVAEDEETWTLRAARELKEITQAGEGSFVIRLATRSEPSPGFHAYRIFPLPENRGLAVEGLQPEGVYWGIKTLKQLLRLEDGKIRLPLVTVHDFSDMEERGIWTQPFGGPFTCPSAGQEESLTHYKAWIDFLSDHKLNLLEVIVAGEGGGIEFLSKSHPEFNRPETERSDFLLRKLFAYGKERGLRMTPIFSHPEHFHFITVHHPELSASHAVAHHGRKLGLPINFFHPGTRALLQDLAQDAAELLTPRSLCFWLAENRLHSLPPDKQSVSEFLQEAQTYHAIGHSLGREVKILLSQGSSPENSALIHTLPHSVKWIFYSGERSGTYNIRQRNPIPPDIAAAAAEGHWISLCNSLRGVPARPTVLSALHRNLGHARDAGLKGLCGMSYAFPGDVMATFVAAQHSWNGSGRSLEGTLEAYARSQSADDARQQATAYRLYDQANETQARRNSTGVGHPQGTFSRYFNMLERIAANDKVDELIMHVADAMEDDEFPMLAQALGDIQRAISLADQNADTQFLTRCHYLLHLLRASQSMARAFYVNCREKSHDLTKGDWSDFRAELTRLFAEIVQESRASIPIFRQLLISEGWGTRFLSLPDPLEQTARFAASIQPDRVTTSRDGSSLS